MVATRLLAAGLAVLLMAAPVVAREPLDGPVPAEVDEVLDGDTLRVRARIWVDQELKVLVRVRGIDAPERRGKCEHERRLAGRAKAYLEAAVASGKVDLTNISGGKYWGRVVADVVTTEGNSVSHGLLRHGLVRPYRGRARRGWCRGSAGDRAD